MSPSDVLLLLAAGIAGGACNAIAGGGTFFTFPALLAAGVPPVAANATSAVAIWPGHAAGVAASRRQLRRHAPRLKGSVPVFAAGAAAGAALLVVLGNAIFADLVPWLIFAATVLFAAGPRLRGHLARRRAGREPRAARAADLAVAVYGGFFGAALGILLMAVLALDGVDDLEVANAVKNALATVVTSVSVGVFVATGVIAWGPAAVVLVGAGVGGYAGARLAGRISPILLRRAVIVIGLLLTWHYL